MHYLYIVVQTISDQLVFLGLQMKYYPHVHESPFAENEYHSDNHYKNFWKRDNLMKMYSKGTHLMVDKWETRYAPQNTKYTPGHSIKLVHYSYKNKGFRKKSGVFLTFRDEMHTRKTGVELVAENTKIENWENPTFWRKLDSFCFSAFIIEHFYWHCNDIFDRIRLQWIWRITSWMKEVAIISS